MLGASCVSVHVGLQLVRHQHHDDVGPFGGLGDVHDFDAFGFSAFCAEAEPGSKRDDDVLHARVPEVQRVGMALAAVADHGDLLDLIRLMSASRS